MKNFQTNIFDEESPGHDKEIQEFGDSKIIYHRKFISKEDSQRYFKDLLEKTKWRQDFIRLYGKELPLPRLTAWYGDTNVNYKYSGILMNPEPWTGTLLEIKQKIESSYSLRLNSVLLNLYRNGSDSINWHQDNEKELGRNPSIASMSFGETRKFQLQSLNNTSQKLEIELEDGSLLLMLGDVQHCWKHQIPKTRKEIGKRINLTFRFISPPF